MHAQQYAKKGKTQNARGKQGVETPSITEPPCKRVVARRALVIHHIQDAQASIRSRGRVRQKCTKMHIHFVIDLGLPLAIAFGMRRRSCWCQSWWTADRASLPTFPTYELGEVLAREFPARRRFRD